MLELHGGLGSQPGVGVKKKQQIPFGLTCTGVLLRSTTGLGHHDVLALLPGNLDCWVRASAVGDDDFAGIQCGGTLDRTSNQRGFIERRNNNRKLHRGGSIWLAGHIQALRWSHFRFSG